MGDHADGRSGHRASRRHPHGFADVIPGVGTPEEPFSHFSSFARMLKPTPLCHSHPSSYPLSSATASHHCLSRPRGLTSSRLLLAPTSHPSHWPTTSGKLHSTYPSSSTSSFDVGRLPSTPGHADYTTRFPYAR
jgi:hypothetical protein